MSEEKLTRAAIVTGGSRGIGRAVCVALAKQGCNVVVNYCHGAEPAEQTAALCRAEGVQAVTVQADVSTAEGCKALFDAAAEAFGRVDVLVNNAGITRDNLILRLTEQDFEAAYQDIIDQNTPLFEKQTESLTTYQMNFLRAVIDGVHSEFTTQEVLQKYQLGSSANVSIIKRALVKKELIEIEKRQVVIPDPVMKVWLKKELGI